MVNHRSEVTPTMNNHVLPAAPDRYERMSYRRCGRWGLRLPAVALGAAFGTIGGRLDVAASRELLCAAFDMGITYFDLANNYGVPPGHAETVVGFVLRELPRDEIVIATKAGFVGWPGPYGVGLSRKYLVASLDRSLSRLGLDYVDLYYAHAPDPETPIEETLATMSDLVRQGKVLYVGLSNFSGEQLDAAGYCAARNGFVPITIHQTPYNVLARGAERELFPRQQRHGMGCAAFYVLGQGVLTGKYRGGRIPPGTRVGTLWKEADRRVGLAPKAMDQIEALMPLAAERGQTLAQFCIAWVLHHPAVTCAVLGATSIAQLRENVAAIARLDFTDEELRTVDAIAPVQ